MRLLPNVLCVCLSLYKSRGPLRAGVNPLLTSVVHTDHTDHTGSHRSLASANVRTPMGLYRKTNIE